MLNDNRTTHSVINILMRLNAVRMVNLQIRCICNEFLLTLEHILRIKTRTQQCGYISRKHGYYWHMLCVAMWTVIILKIVRLVFTWFTLLKSYTLDKTRQDKTKWMIKPHTQIIQLANQSHRQLFVQNNIVHSVWKNQLNHRRIKRLYKNEKSICHIKCVSIARLRAKLSAAALVTYDWVQ